jgi:hypothetical protein
MDALEYVRLGMAGKTTVTVTSEMTVGHFVAYVPRVYATPMQAHVETSPISKPGARSAKLITVWARATHADGRNGISGGDQIRR